MRIMNEPHRFDEHLLSGYLDGELTQGDAQRVRLHLEECPDCRRTLEEIRNIKEATMSTEFRLPPDDQWNEAPRSGASGMLRTFGWAIALAWFIGIVGYALWRAATDAEDLLAAVLVFGFWLGFLLLFLSVLIDRIKASKTDRYRKVEK
jgi:anti-sigma factor RsiW